MKTLKQILRTIFNVDQHAPIPHQAAGFFSFLLLAYGTSLILGLAVLSYTLGAASGNERPAAATQMVTLS